MEGKKMALLYVTFKPNTSREWMVEKLTGMGLEEVDIMVIKKEGDCVFLPMVNLNHCNALIQVPDNKGVEYTRAIRILSSQIVSIHDVSVGRIIAFSGV